YTLSLFRTRARLEHRPSGLRAGHGRANRRAVMKTSRALLTPPVSPRDHVLGPADARVTLVEFGDFECPFCGAAYPGLHRGRRELDAHTHAARVHEDFLSGVRSGVSGTPRFFINGRPHEEPGDAKTLAAALRRAL